MGYEGLFKYEIMLHWLAVIFYIGSAFFYILGVVFGLTSSLSRGQKLLLLGLVLHGIALLTRWSYVSHGPYITKYEVLSSNAWIMNAFFLFVSHKHPRLRFSGMFVVPLSFTVLAAGILTDRSIKRLPPGFENIWLVFHILFNKLAVGAFLVALGLSIFYYLKVRNYSFKFLERLPTCETLDEYGYQFVTFGFCFWTITIVAGAIWAKKSWGRYWGWDPVENWSLITWLLFGLYLHLRRFFGWRGIKGVIFLFFAFSVSMLTIFFLPFLVESLHSVYFG